MKSLFRHNVEHIMCSMMVTVLFKCVTVPHRWTMMHRDRFGKAVTSMKDEPTATS